MAKRYSKDKAKEKKIALEHIKELFSEAEKVYKKDMTLANKYVKKARDIQMKFQLRMPKENMRMFCKHCYSYLVPSVSSRVRINEGKVVILCLNCSKFMRFPL